MQNSQHILVIRLSAMGDVAMSVPVIKTLLKQNPNIQITFLSKAFLKPLFEDMERVHFVSADVKKKHKGIKGLYALYKALKKLNIDAVADLHNVLRSKILRFFFKFDNIQITVIDKGRAEKKALTSLKNKIFKPLKTTHQRYAEVFKKLGLTIDLNNPSLKTRETLTDDLKLLFDYQSNEKLIGIAPFATHQGKKYPLVLMEKVIEILSKQHKVLLFGGGEQETNLLINIANNKSNTYCLAGKIKLKQELAIISNLNIMLSMDSANGHFSALYGVPTLTIWGNTHPYAGFAPFQQSKNCITANRTQYPLLPTSIYGNKNVKGYENVMKSIHPKTIINKVLSTIK